MGNSWLHNLLEVSLLQFDSRKLAILLGWVLFVYVAYKTSQYDYEYANFDPYEILQVEVGASQADIKSAYRKLSRIYHPDKQTGDEKTFLKITRAHQVSRCYIYD